MTVDDLFDDFLYTFRCYPTFISGDLNTVCIGVLLNVVRREDTQIVLGRYILPTVSSSNPEMFVLGTQGSFLPVLEWYRM